MISAYSLSFPLLSLHFLNITEASTLAGEKVLGSLSSEITLNRIVLKTEKRGQLQYQCSSELLQLDFKFSFP
jgi:hypothetical protein